VVVPSGAGVGSAIGFLRAPVAYEVVRSLYQRFSTFDISAVNALLAEMQEEAIRVVSEGSFGARMQQSRTAYMRYVGQGHEIRVSLPARELTADDVAAIRAAYDVEYTRFYDRPVPGSDVEVLSYAVVVSTVQEQVSTSPSPNPLPQREGADPAATIPLPLREGIGAGAERTQPVRDTVTGETAEWPVYDRNGLGPGTRISGPAIIAEDETSTLLGPGWSAKVDRVGYIELVREG
jgi:N-methylhydantoinase A